MVIEFSCLSNKDGEVISHQREGVGLCDKSFDSLLFASSEDSSGSPNFLQPSKGGRSSSDLGFTQRVALRPIGHHFSRISTHGSWTGGKFDRIRHWEETTKFQETQGEGRGLVSRKELGGQDVSDYGYINMQFHRYRDLNCLHVMIHL